VTISAAITGQGVASGTLGAKGSLAAAITGVGSVVATPGGLGSLASVIAGHGSVIAAIGTAKQISAAINGSGSVLANGVGTLTGNIASGILGVGSVVGFLSFTRTFFPPKNPGFRVKNYILRDFGATYSAPAYLATTSNALQLFHQTTFIPNANPGTVTPPQWSTPGTPDAFNYQGRVQMPGEVMSPPGTGSLNGKIYKVKADGMVFIPQSAVGASFNIVLNQNYTTYGYAIISDTLFSLTSQVPVAAGTMAGWSLTATLAGNGVGNPALSCAGIMYVDGVQYVGNGFSSRLVNREPIIQLSLGVQFGGALTGPDKFQAFLSTFQIKEDHF
jgi:hypothetical protein